MKDIRAIIDTLTPEERRDFVSGLRRKSRRGDIKNVSLFKLLEQGKTDALDIAIYGKPARNAFHALSKRLKDHLIDYVAAKSFAGETSEEMESIKNLMASRIFFEHKHYKIAFKTLTKAEQIARNHDLYSILVEIFQTKIQFAHLNSSLDLNEIIQAAELNNELHQRELQLNKAYATIRNRINKGDRNISKVISESFATFDIEIDSYLTFKSLYQLLTILITAAELKSDYFTIIPFVDEIYIAVMAKREKAHKHHYYHLEILKIMALVSFRNKDFTRSKQFTSKLENELQKNNSVFYNRFSESLVLLKAMNANYTGNSERAIELLASFPRQNAKTIISLILCLFQQQKFRLAYEQLKKLQHSDGYYEKKEGLIWVLQKNIIEILLLIELDKVDLVWSRITSFKKRFNPQLKLLDEQRAINFIKLVGWFYENPSEVTSSEFAARVESAFEWKDAHQEDIFVMSFYAWLKSKMIQKPIYEVTLDLVSSYE